MLTRRVLLLEAVNGGPLGFGLEQEQEHRFEDACHVTKGERPHQPALGSCANGAVRAGQAVQYNEQRPVCGTTPLSQCPVPLCARAPPGNFPHGAWRPMQTRITRFRPYFHARISGAAFKTQCPGLTPNQLNATVGVGPNELASKAVCPAPHLEFWKQSRGFLQSNVDYSVWFMTLQVYSPSVATAPVTVSPTSISLQGPPWGTFSQLHR